ncbi:MAG TPA: EF-hand domain-containing protein [Gemmataceae bacterium]|nr:EF-hand domain-containing protein [Gemmataceae bacterium]
MRVTRWSLMLLGCLALALLTADVALTQWGGGRRGGWGGGGGGRFDPSFLFNRYANGKDYIVIAEVTRDRDKTAMTEYAQRKGIGNGRLTREQFADYMQDRMAARFGNRGGAAAPSSPTSPTAAPAGDDPAKISFDRLDANKDGVLTDQEIPEGLKADLGKWDSNRDGKVQLDEYRAYFKAHPPADAAVSGVSIFQPPSLAELDKRATVYRAGSLPPELQRTWFEDYDTDKDGQVGLYEWKASGRSVAEFRAMDTNGDGFVTAEEALHYLKKNPGAFGNGAGQVGRGATVAGRPGASDRGARPFGRGRGNASDGDPNDWRSRIRRGDRGQRRGPSGSP